MTVHTKSADASTEIIRAYADVNAKLAAVVVRLSKLLNGEKPELAPCGWPVGAVEALADKIVTGILVYGFNNDREIEVVLKALKQSIAGTIEYAIRENESLKTNPPEEIARVASAESQAVNAEGIRDSEIVDHVEQYLTAGCGLNTRERAELITQTVFRLIGRPSLFDGEGQS
jgi:hypothetical protein